VGVWWHAAVMAEPRCGAKQVRPQALHFARLLL
jgi:hypothetical protein